jgi:hypothetical protein
LILFIFLEPLDTFSTLPKTILLGLFLSIDVSADTVLFATMPPAIVFAAISPIINAKAFLLVVHVLAVIAHTIRVNVNSVPLHIIVGPGAVVLAAISPQINAVTINFVVFPIAIVGG